MSSSQIFVVAIAAAAVLAAIAIFAVAFRRGDATRSAAAELDRRAARKDEARRRELAAARAASAPGGTAVLVLEDEPEPEAEPEPLPDPLELRPEVSPEEYGVTRRMFLNRSLAAVFGVFLLQFAIGFLAFFWPKLKTGGFGGKIDAGAVDEIRDQIFQPDGTIAPLFVPAAQSYIVPFDEEAENSSFDGIANLVIADNLMALWQRCVHLGCRVPTCLPSQGFECPCHGSKYNFHGEYEAGPAPRNMDRFAVEVNDNGRLIVDTGTILQTARAKIKTIAYPQGPSCLSAGGGEGEEV